MKVVIAAGGTGGHINPAISLAQEIKSRDADAQILFVGTADRMEATLVPKAGFELATIEISGFQRSFRPADIKRNLLTLKRLLFVSGQVEKILKEFQPDVVVGFGGYVSGPVVRTAHKMGFPTAIHEQNAYPGKTNIALSKYADAVMLTTKAAEKHMHAGDRVHVTGLPVRGDILSADRDFARAQLKIGDKTLIFSTGGSLGSAAVNKCMTDVILKSAHRQDVIFVHGCGKYGTDMLDVLKENGITPQSHPHIRVQEYIYDMASYLAACDLFINRAGASSIAEIQALGVTSLLIPSPNVAENHQYHNAMALVEQDAAFLIEEKDLSADKVIEIIDTCIKDPARRAQMGINAGKMGVKDAQSNICDIVMRLTDVKSK